MNKELVIEKGYTLTVTSWENDGDNYRTESMTVETLEEARRIYRVCTELFKSCNKSECGIGNSMSGECEDVIEEYIKDNPELNLDEDTISNLAYELMGSSEYYDYRVCESVSVTYSPKDIYLETIEF
jgi:hypothetical protein